MDRCLNRSEKPTSRASEAGRRSSQNPLAEQFRERAERQGAQLVRGIHTLVMDAEADMGDTDAIFGNRDHARRFHRLAAGGPPEHRSFGDVYRSLLPSEEHICRPTLAWLTLVGQRLTSACL